MKLLSLFRRPLFTRRERELLAELESVIESYDRADPLYRRRDAEAASRRASSCPPDPPLGAGATDAGP